MEILFWYISGILCSMLIMLAVAIVGLITYCIFKFAFWIFEVFGIENPFCVIYSYMTKK